MIDFSSVTSMGSSMLETLETAISLEPGYFDATDFPTTDNIVWLLGKSYAVRTPAEREDLKSVIHSRLWFTYRRNFPPIGGTGPTSDQGWGCMLRCGQMLMGQSLLSLHLGRDWMRNRNTVCRKYLKILRLFQDHKTSLYSIHQIAQMGTAEGEDVRKWCGPNNVAHVLRKLSIYDEMSNLAVHVAMDQLVIVENLVKLCTTDFHPDKADYKLPTHVCSGCQHPSVDFSRFTPIDQFCPCASCAPKADVPGSTAQCCSGSTKWKPLLLIIPLRLGLAEFNPIYSSAVKELFMIKYCVGIIGGRPSHALYFIGIVGDELIYLDPHICQPVVDFDAADDQLDDSSYHCPFVLRMPLVNMETSLALGFFCRNEAEMRDLMNCFRKSLLKASDPPLFEVCDIQPPGFPPFIPYAQDSESKPDFAVIEPQLDSDEEFEVLS